MAYARHLPTRGRPISAIKEHSDIADSGEVIPDTESNGREGCGIQAQSTGTRQSAIARGGVLADTISERQQGQGEYVKPLLAEALGNWKAINAESGCISGIWAIEPLLDRVANGIPARSHRLKGLGNAVVPQIPELIGRAILEYEQSLSPSNPEISR
jgi:hypothetical protein